MQTTNGYAAPTYRAWSESIQHRLLGLRLAVPFRLVHGAAGLEQVAAELDAWLERCDVYDAGPTKWLADRRREAEAAVQREREQR